MRIDNAVTYTARNLDAETGLLYFRNRYQHPHLGRFVTRDPIGYADGLSLYRAYFVPRDVDPQGLGVYQEGTCQTPPPIDWDNDFVFGSDVGNWTWAELSAWQWWGTKLNVAESLGHLPDGTRAYRHYRTASGTDLQINYDKAYREDTNIKAFVDREIGSAQNEAERLLGNRCEDISITGDWVSSNGYYPRTENWQKAIGGHSIWGCGKVSAEKVSTSECSSCCLLTLEVTITMEDFYNFNRGEADLATGASDNINGRFEELGWARSFYSRGSLNRTVTWCKGQAPDLAKLTGGGWIRERRGEGRGRDRDRGRRGRR